MASFVLPELRRSHGRSSRVLRVLSCEEYGGIRGVRWYKIRALSVCASVAGVVGYSTCLLFRPISRILSVIALRRGASTVVMIVIAGTRAHKSREADLIPNGANL